MKHIYFIASYGDFNKLPLGGGQTAARRLLTTLRGLGYDVIAIHRHPPVANKRFFRGFQFAFWLLLDSVYVFFKLLFKSRHNSITLYMGYLGSVLVPLEYIMSAITRSLGFKNVLYLAGGGTETVFQNSCYLSSFFQQRTIKNYYLVMTEGIENIDFVKRISRTSTFYLPNFTECGFYPQTCPEKPNDRWNLIYFGRIVPEKNVGFSIDVYDLLCTEYDNLYLTIIGGGDENYCRFINERINVSPNKKRITRMERISHNMLKDYLYDQHFFLFPSKEPREGHSNALNEAMSYGLVPIVSDNNFLPSIVGDERLVMRSMDANSFAKGITEIINSGEYDDLSHKMYERVQKHFTQNVVEKNLKEKLDTLYYGKH